MVFQHTYSCGNIFIPVPRRRYKRSKRQADYGTVSCGYVSEYSVRAAYFKAKQMEFYSFGICRNNGNTDLRCAVIPICDNGVNAVLLAAD